MDVTTLNRFLIEASVSIPERVQIMLGRRDDTIDEFWQKAVSPFANFLKETNKNIVQHSGDSLDSGNGYFVIGTKRSRTRPPRVLCCICDGGIGFSKSLSNKGFRITNDANAIREAFLHRYESDEEGKGLFDFD